MTAITKEEELRDVISSFRDGYQFIAVSNKIIADERITEEEGLLLFENASLALTATLANYIREKKHADRTYFNRNFHIEPTNLCVYDCKFCSYSRLIKERSQGWEYTMDDMLNMVKKY